MVDINTIQDNKEEISKEIAGIINNIFGKGAEVHIHTSLDATEDEYTGVYASAFIHDSSITRQEQSQLEDNGLHLVEQAVHITENPDMDNSITEIPRDKLDLAAETDLELVLELDTQFIKTV